MKSYDLDLLQKQTKKKRNSPMLMPAEVIKRAERFKSSIAITPPLDTCHLHGDTGCSTLACRRARGECDTPIGGTALQKELLKDRKEGFPAGL